MSLSKRYNPSTREPQIARQWQERGVYHFERGDEKPVYSIDTPPPTVSGKLHLGHVFSYSHTDFVARFWRMNGYSVYYPMGFDDNGLPTERLVEQRQGVRATEIGREAFIERCLAVSEEAEKDYEALWRRLGLSIDWRYRYRTIEARARRTAQWSFLELYEKGLIYRQKAPVIWCPECRTAIAQAEVEDLDRHSTFYTLAFHLADGETVPIATTRPELLPACVAVFIHPDDPHSERLVGKRSTVPLYGQEVPIIADEAADPQKGTGIVMCCTFGDATDVEWWRVHELPLVEAIGRDGTMLAPAGKLAGDTVEEARRNVVESLRKEDLLLEEEPTPQSVRVHERCDTPVEYVVARQWFVSLLAHREELLEAGEAVSWHPPHMKERYRQWVENLAWDWCISRQRYFGVTFPVWYCEQCGATLLAQRQTLPVDPTEEDPPRPCPECGSTSTIPEKDVMDTWATSSMSPQIAGHFLSEPDLYEALFPYSLRPQAHEIIRTWAFYTIAKSHFHFGRLPWSDVAISGWGLAPEGSGKISKSRGGGPVAPMAMIEQYSADAVRYWAASTGLGKDSVIDEQKIEAGAKLVTKLWNVARFSQRFLQGYELETALSLEDLSPADRWLLSRTQRLIARVTSLFEVYDHATAKSEIEVYFWTELADNYLEMAKKRLYDDGDGAEGARFTLHHALVSTLKMLAPLLPYVTDAIYTELQEKDDSIHRSHWPEPDERLIDEEAERGGRLLVEIATAVRRYKSETNLSLGAPIDHLHLDVPDEPVARWLSDAQVDLASVTRARKITVNGRAAGQLTTISEEDGVTVALSTDEDED